MSILQAVKRNIMGIAGALGILTTVVGGVLAVETRYAKAADYESVQREQYQLRDMMKNQMIQQQVFYIDYLQQQRLVLERDIMLLRRKVNRSDDDIFMLDSYTARLEEVRKKIEEAQRSVGLRP